MSVNRSTGLIDSYHYKGKSLLGEGGSIKPNFWRAPTDNDMGAWMHRNSSVWRKPQLLLMYSPDLVKAGKNAQADVKEAAKCIQGGGGGQPGLATAGGRLADGLKEALEALVAAATA